MRFLKSLRIRRHHADSKTWRGIHFMLELYYTKTRVLTYSERVERNQKYCGRPGPSTCVFVNIIKFRHKMDATPSFRVTMICEVPSNPQFTLICVNIFLTAIGKLHERIWQVCGTFQFKKSIKIQRKLRYVLIFKCSVLLFLRMYLIRNHEILNFLETFS